MIKRELNKGEWKLLDDFNNRVPNGYEQIYLLFAKSLNIFAANLYGCFSHESQDTVEDSFVNLWLSKNKFDSLLSIKAYLYISVKNNYLSYKKHSVHTENYRLSVENEGLTDTVIESELYSIVDEAIKLLPSEYGEVIRKFVDGYKPAEIAKILGKTEQSIYKIKHHSLNILRKKITKDKTFILFPFL